MTDTGNAALWFELLMGLMVQQTKISAGKNCVAQYALLRAHSIGENINGTQTVASNLPALSPLRGAE